MSSICGITPLPGRTGYVASKHAMEGFMETIRVENAAENLHVMLVHPGFTASNIRNIALNSLGIPQMENPRNEDKLMPAERVANQVAEGIIQKKKSLTLTSEGRLITWIYKHMPNVAEKLIYREMKNEIGAPF
jgi:short-subunit dehydrogenase